jgi:hypothetical protein
MVWSGPRRVCPSVCYQELDKSDNIEARHANGISKKSKMIHELKRPSSSVLAIDCPFPEALAIIRGSLVRDQW